MNGERALVIEREASFGLCFYFNKNGDQYIKRTLLLQAGIAHSFSNNKITG